MRLEQLYYLSELAKHPSINTASSNLNLTQQSLSNSIKSLEEELNCTILKRSYKGISFTEDGEKVLQVAKNILNEWKILQHSLSHNQQEKEISPLRIISSHRIISNYLTKYCNQFIKLYPDIPLFCEAESNHTIINRFEDYMEYDLICATCIKKNSKLITELPKYLDFHLFKTLDFYLVVNHQSDLAKYKSIDISNLREYPIKMYSDFEEFSTQEQENDFQKYLTLMGFNKNLVVSNSITYCMQGVLDNDFSLLISEGSQMDLFLHPKTVAIPVITNYQFQYGYLLPVGIELNPNAKNFIKLLNN